MPSRPNDLLDFVHVTTTKKTVDVVAVDAIDIRIRHQEQRAEQKVMFFY